MMLSVDIAMVLGAAFVAGCIDAMVGGGGLIQMPALLSMYPDTAPATLLGTNKFASIFGTSNAVRGYLRRIELPWRELRSLMVLALVMAMLGAWVATRVPATVFRPLVPVLLVVVLVYVVWQRRLGQEQTLRELTTAQTRWAALLVAGIAFYDGFFGPGTGSFFMLVFIRMQGCDFLHAAARSRVLNTATNLGALLLFASHGHVLWVLGVAMAISNVLGSTLGTHLALRGGSQRVRWVFIAVVTALILRTAWQAFG